MKPLRWILFIALALTLTPPLFADDDDDGGAVLDPKLQWQLADAAWIRRQYDDAASLNKGFAEQNPDDPSALEALWRNYYIFRHTRPNEAKRKATFDLLSKESVRWSRVYLTSDKNRAAQALWYQALSSEQELGRPAGILILQDILKKFPDTPKEMEALWYLGEWTREAGKFQEAAGYYAAYTKKGGISQMTANTIFREGWMDLELKNTEAAVTVYRQILDKKFEWGWGEVHWNAVDAAEKLKAAGEVKLARELALKVIDVMPGRTDSLIARARAVLGEKTGKKINIYPHTLYNYSSDKVSISPQSKLTLVRDIPVLVRLSYVTKDDPFKATISLTPKFTVQAPAENMQKADGNNAFTADIVAPDEKGNVTGDWWYRFKEAPRAEAAPDDLTITRSWKAAGTGWGESTIRIQSKTRWHLWIYMPNAKTNVNNISGSLTGAKSVQPNEVNDGGKTFRWYDWYDLSQGMTLKIPIEVGGDVTEYYPRLRLEHGVGRYNNSAATGKDAVYQTNEFTVKLSSDAAFLYSFEFPANNVVQMDEIKQ